MLLSIWSTLKISLLLYGYLNVLTLLCCPRVNSLKISSIINNNKLVKVSNSKDFNVNLYKRDFKYINSNYIRPKVVSCSSLLDSSMFPSFSNAIIINGLFSIILSLSKQKSLTKEGLLHSTVLGVGLWTFLGYQGWSLCVFYLIMGSIVTKLRISEKEKLGIAEKRGGARGPENVWGSAAAAMVCATLTYILPSLSKVLLIGYVAALATKLSDTVSSEIGKAYGRTTYLITNLKRVPKGTEGAISLEGTIAGIISSFIISLIGASLKLININDVMICVIAAFIATTIESFIGATFQNKVSWLNNELVNLINTVIGASVAFSLAILR